MPISKVPVVHKFGIISHSQRLELQERLLRQTHLFEDKKPAITHYNNPLEVTDDFIQKYNQCESIDERQKYETQAKKMFERIKRRSGLLTLSQGAHVDLPVAWTELSQLAQCKGAIQEECLDALIASLDQAPLHSSHVAALFFLAESCLYWLRTDSIPQPYLRSAELKLLRTARLVFSRLLYHRLTGCTLLHAGSEFIGRLSTYLNGFSDSQTVYSPYPNALFCMRYVIEAGKVITRRNAEDPNEHNAKDNDAADNSEQASFRDVSARFASTRSSHSGALTDPPPLFTHIPSPTLWQALRLWHDANSGTVQPDVNAFLDACACPDVPLVDWLDAVGVLHVVSDAAMRSVVCLRAMQKVACGRWCREGGTNEPRGRMERGVLFHRGAEPAEQLTLPAHTEQAASSAFKEKDEAGPLPRHREAVLCTHPAHTEQAESSAFKESNEVGPLGLNTCETLEEQKLSELDASRKVGNTVGEHINVNTAKLDKLQAMNEPDLTQMDAAGTVDNGVAIDRKMTNDEGAISTTKGVLAEEETLPSSAPTFSNLIDPSLSGLHGWNWELGLTYCDLLTEICLHGNTSAIKKCALVGLNRDYSELHRISQPSYPMRSAGLLDLVYFKTFEINGADDWSWRIRYAAMSGVVKIVQYFKNDPEYDGMRTVGWNTLIQANSSERDARVLEALKVGQVDVKIEELMSRNVDIRIQTLGAKIASGLCAKFLLSAQTSVPPKKPQPKPSKTKKSSLSPPSKSVKPTPRATLREEIMLSTSLDEPTPSFNTRTTTDLKAVIEDQWRKELHQALEEEEEERKKELQQKILDDQKKREEIEEQRKKKLGSKYKGPAYQL